MNTISWGIMSGLDGVLQPFEPWYWLAIGLVLLSVELLISGAYFLWIGASALFTGVISWFIPLHPAAQVMLFAVLAIMLVWASRKFFPRHQIIFSETLLNSRGAQLVGLELVLDEPIHHGKAQVQIGDSKWMVRGPELLAGQKVVVTRVEGVILIVEPVF